MLPNFLIVGAMKAGTSTLRDHLLGVDDLFIAEDELHFFSDDAKYGKGIDWYARFFAGAGSSIAVGEKTATYSYLPAVPARIRKHLPGARIIWIFREPVARAYSHYWHSVKNGSEPLSFDAAIRREEARLRTDIWKGYRSRSLYADQVQRFLDLMSGEQMLYLLFEDLVRDPETAVNRVLRFLSVPETFRRPEARLHANATFATRSPRVQWLARQVLGRGSTGWHLVKRLNRRDEPGYPRMSDACRSWLTESFRDSNERLAEMTGLDLSCWAKPDSRRTPVGQVEGSYADYPQRS